MHAANRWLVPLLLPLFAAAPFVAFGEDEAAGPAFAVTLDANGQAELTHDPALPLLLDVTLVNFDALEAAAHNAMLEVLRVELDADLAEKRIDKDAHAKLVAELALREVPSASLGSASSPWAERVEFRVTHDGDEVQWPIERLVRPPVDPVADLGEAGGVTAGFGVAPDALAEAPLGVYRVEAWVEAGDDAPPVRAVPVEIELVSELPLEERPSDAVRLVLIGEHALRAGNDSHAENLARMALEAQPGFFAAHLLWSDVHVARANLEQALEQCLLAEAAFGTAYPDAYEAPLEIAEWCTELANTLTGGDAP